MIKETLKCIKSHLTEKKEKRSYDSITDEEITNLETKYCGEDMPDDGQSWVYTGYCYMNS